MDIIVNSTVSPLWSKMAKTEEPGNYYHNILTCLGYPPNSPPVADFLRRYHKLEGDWLIASPVHWQATHNDAMIIACDDALDLSDDESRRWFAALSRFLIYDKVKLHYHDAYTWLIQFEDAPPVNARPVHTLLQKSMRPHLQALDARLFWSSFITENQMFFSEHALNKARAGRYVINGVWIWGGGNLKAPGSRPLVCTDETGFDLAGLLSTQVSRYAPGYKFRKKSILLYSDFDERQSHLFEKYTVHWHWNNTNYVTKPKNWFARLFGRKPKPAL